MNTFRRDAGRRFFPETLVDESLAKVATGHSVIRFCDENLAYPAASTWYGWLAEYSTLRERYQAALIAGEAAKEATPVAVNQSRL